MTAVYVLWIILLIVTVLVLPIVVRYLNSVYLAARNIERYFREMKNAGIGIAGNTDHIKALNDTISVASGILDVAGEINNNADTLKGALADRAAKNN
ncbi:MAG: hypothetical protein RJQ09_07935 [Cyclobacteriaceae bacterium]